MITINNRVVKTDDFVLKLLNIAKKCKHYKHFQDIYFGIYRNDYMYDTENNKWLQAFIKSNQF